jgi:hypothetical protein
VQESKQTPSLPPAPDELETYRRLVDLQSQIVELARRNSESERLCRLLRERLDQQTSRRRGTGPRKMLAHFLERVRETYPFNGRTPRTYRRLNPSSGTSATGTPLDRTHLESI